jgi:hypothetical protein
VRKTSAFQNARRTHCLRAGETDKRPGGAIAIVRACQRARARRARPVGVLTAKKTVIRFRHNNIWPQQRVSANPATTCNTTQSSARKVVMVDLEVVSLAKTPGGQRHATRGAERSGFFRVEEIRPDAPGASAVDRGSDTRGVFRTGQ